MGGKELIEVVATITGDDKETVKRILRTAGGVIRRHHPEDKQVTFPGLGKFFWRFHKPRHITPTFPWADGPQDYTVPGRTVLKFKETKKCCNKKI